MPLWTTCLFPLPQKSREGIDVTWLVTCPLKKTLINFTHLHVKLEKAEGLLLDVKKKKRTRKNNMNFMCHLTTVHL